MSNIKKESSTIGAVGGNPGQKVALGPLGGKPQRKYSSFEELILNALVRDQKLGEVVRKRGDHWVLFDDENDSEVGVFTKRKDAWDRQRQRRKSVKAKKKAERESRKRKRLETSSGVYKSKSPDEKRKTKKKMKKWRKFDETIKRVGQALNESMIAYVFQNPPSSEDAHIWDDFISKLSRDVVMSDKNLGNILRGIADVEAQTLGKAAQCVVKSLGPKFPTQVKKISRDPQGEILVDLVSELQESGKEVCFSVKLENSRPIVEFPQQTMNELNADGSEDTKMLRAELIYLQATKLKEMDDVVKQLEGRNEYLKELKSKCMEMFEALSPLQVEVFRNIFKKEGRKKKPVQAKKDPNFSRHDLETDDELGTGTTKPENDKDFVEESFGEKVADFGQLEDKASKMSDEQLHYALVDITKTLPNLDKMDRQDGGNRAGYYRDEASVYRMELKRRMRKEK